MRKTNNTPGISEKLDSIISRLDRFRRQAFWLVVIVFAATIVLAVINLNASSDPPYLILTLNILFVGVPCLFFAGIAANSFVRTGVWPAIWLGAGSLAFGLAVLLSGPLQTFSTINSTITIHNILTLIDQARLFQSFERLGARVHGSIQGIGLGLRVCRILVEAHHGRIWVESESGKGSSFFFTLPLLKL